MRASDIGYDGIVQRERYFRSHTDDVDLIELLLLLWRERLQIIIFLTIALTMASGYIIMTKAQWLATSYITAPRLAKFSDYLEQRRAVARVLGLSVAPADISNELFGHFTSMAQRPNEKHAYLLTTGYVQKETAGMNTREKQHWLEQVAEKELLILSPDNRKNIPYFVLEARADAPETASSLMQGYVDYINRKVLQQDKDEFLNSVEALVSTRQKELTDIEFSQQTQHDNQLKELSRSLDIARQAGIKDYYTRSAQEGNAKIELANTIHQYMLGENFLNAEINALKNSPIVYPVRYHDIKRELRILAPLLTQNAIDKTYSYQFTLNALVRKLQPKSLLILTLGALFGLIAGAGFVLARHAISQYSIEGKANASDYSFTAPIGQKHT